jgi:tRNA 2-selenouridine synthase
VAQWVIIYTTMQVPEFLSGSGPILDVRSPGEFEQGHITGAVSFPLFSNEERAAVGKAYKLHGKDRAYVLGLEYVGPKMAGFVKQARKLAPDGRLRVHCWRGGMRSGSMGWLLRQAGMDVTLLTGGYKAYRRQVLEALQADQLPPVCVVGGRTGCGKTKVLHALRQLGEQVIDLEGLAHHKGSAFGFIGEQEQPTVEQFENDLFYACSNIDPTRRVWIENESRSIGRVFIPEGMWHRIRHSTLFNIAIPDEVRLRNLVGDYVLEHTDALRLAFQKIQTKLGGLQYKNAMKALDKADFITAAAIALAYYDKTYQHGLDTNTSTVIHRLQFEHGDPELIARHLMGMG